MIKKLYPSLLFIIFCSLISLPVILPYFHPGYFPTHDGEWAVVRLADMFRSLRDHQFPVRYSGNLNFGYGYPLFNFTYPAPYYLGVLFHFLRFGFTDTIKLLFAASVFLSALGMYSLSTRVWGNKIAGLVSAFLYVYFPYRIVDLYARGSIGESLAFALFPFILLFVDGIIHGTKVYRYVILASFSYALLILTHNIMAVLFTPVLVLFVLLRMYSTKSRDYLSPLLFIIASFALSAFFWLPAIVEKNNILLSRIPIADRSIYFVHFYQLVIPRWGYGLPDHPDGFSYQLGLPQIFVLLMVIGLLVYFWRGREKIGKSYHFQLALLLVGLSVLFIFMMFSVSSFLWQLPILKEINYPWTLLGPIGFCISLMAGFLCLQKRVIGYLVIGLCIVAGMLILPNARPSTFFDKSDGYYLTNEATTTSSSELMPLWVKTLPNMRAPAKVQVIHGQGTVDGVSSTSRQLSAIVNLQSASTIQINTIYYPGWGIWLDGQPATFSFADDLGVMQLKVPAGRHTVGAKFRETPLRKVSDVLSLLTLFMLLFILVLDLGRSRFPAKSKK